MKQRQQKGALLLIPSAFIATAIVFGLLYLMYTLIAVNLEEPKETTKIKIDDIWQQEQEIEDQVKEREIEKIDEVEELPPELPKSSIDIETSLDAVDISGVTGKVEVDIGLGGGFSDGDIIPLVAVLPQYPRRAADRGIEGYCVVKFVITTDGTTRDHEIAETTHSVFERSSIKAAQRLKYKPKIVDGKPVEVDHFYKFTYQLAK